MRTIRRIFTRRAPSGVPAEAPEAEIPTFEVEEAPRIREIGEIEPIYVKSMDLQSIADVQEVTRELQGGNIVILDITPLMDEDPEDLKRAIDQLKGICQGIGGSIGRLTEYKVIATPKFVHIQFKKEEA
jgi:hypothetical protein